MLQITSFHQIKDIIEPIPAEKFITGDYGDGQGNCCFLGHIHVALSRDKDPKNKDCYWGDFNGYGARELTAEFLRETYPEEYKKLGSLLNGAQVNNSPTVNNYTEPVIKDRLMHMIEDGIKWERSKLNQ